MLHIQRILHPTDFSDYAHAALEQALYLARRHDARLDVLHVVPTFGEDPIRGAFAAAIDEETFYQTLHQATDRQLEAYLAAHDVAGVAVRRVPAHGPSVKAAILEYAAQEDMDLIVLGTRGRGGLTAALLGSVAEAVVRQARCPVLTVHAREGGGAPPAVLRVLAPFDFSVYAREALRYARELAHLYGATIDVLHVVEPGKGEADYRSLLEEEGSTGAFEEGALEDMLRQALQRIYRQTPGPEAAMTPHLRKGHPADEILAFARAQSVDLIVMATHGLGGLRHYLTGSVAERVVRHAPCPVFTVRSFGKSLLYPAPRQEETRSSV